MHANIGLINTGLNTYFIYALYNSMDILLKYHVCYYRCLLVSWSLKEEIHNGEWLENIWLWCVCVVQGVRVGVGMGGSDGWQSPAEHIAPLIKAALQSTCSWGCIFSLWLPPHFTIIFKSENWFKCQKEWCPSSYCTSPLSSINSYIHTMWLSIGVCCFLF